MAAAALHAPLAGELRQGPPDRDEAAAVAGGELAFRREEVAGTPFACIERRAEVEVDLMMKRDGTELESEAGHREGGNLAGAILDGLCGVEPLARRGNADNVISNLSSRDTSPTGRRSTTQGTR
jgi:hypothetical protein